MAKDKETGERAESKKKDPKLDDKLSDEALDRTSGGSGCQSCRGGCNTNHQGGQDQ